MKAIRFMGAAALAATLAGCAGTTGLKPSLSTAVAPEAAKPVVTAALPVEPPAARIPARRAPVRAPSVLPERVAVVPRHSPVPAPVPVQVPVVRTVPVAPPVPAPVPAPRYQPVVTVEAPVYEPVRTVVVPAPEAVMVAVPEAPRYSAIGDLDAPAPVPLPAPVQVATIPVAPVPVMQPQPAYEPVVAVAPPSTTRRAMAPIRDDPEDGRNGRRAAAAEVNIHARKGYRRNAAIRAGGLKPKIRSNFTPAFGMDLEQAALGRINPSIRYDARYVPIGYPWGDVDEATGVCSDVVIRSYRTLGIDLQKLVHEDMKRAFRAYPSQRIYGLKTVDANIDHRRVVNLEAFFERTGASIEIGTSPEDFLPGDVLTWRLSGNEPHIGIVVSDLDPRTGMPLVVHNLGAGVRKEDLITLSAPVGHFRFAPDRQTVVAALVTKQ